MMGLDHLKIGKKKAKINIFLAWDIEIMIMVLTKPEWLVNRDDY